MRYFFFVLLVVTAFAVSPCRAQVSTAELITNVRFYTESAEDHPVELRFGFGYRNTDSADYDRGEILVPGPPPQSFYIVHTDQDIGQTCNKDRSNWDIRGIPDSVLSGSSKVFTMTYEYEIWRYIGRFISCHFNWGMPRGLDSVVMQDFITGKIFRHTFVNNNQLTDTATIQNDGISLVKMTAYFNVDHLLSAVPMYADGAQNVIRVQPNVARSGEAVRIMGLIPTQTKASLVNTAGTVVIDNIDVTSQHLKLTDLSDGMYRLMMVNSSGQLIASLPIAILK